MVRRRPTGNSMTEYSIGIGAVLAVCMLVMGGLGFAAQDVVGAVLKDVNARNDQSVDVSNSSMGGIWNNGVAGKTSAPWQLQ